MNQMTTFTMIMTGLMLLFYVMGLVQTNPLLNLVMSPQSIANSALFLAILFAIVIGSAIVFGLVYKNPELATMSVIMPLIVSILWSFSEVIVRVLAAGTVLGLLGLLIFGPIMVVYVLTTVEYWRGRD